MDIAGAVLPAQVDTRDRVEVRDAGVVRGHSHGARTCIRRSCRHGVGKSVAERRVFVRRVFNG